VDRTPPLSIPAPTIFFASCGDGNLTVIHEDSADNTPSSKMCPQKRPPATMGFDLKTHNSFSQRRIRTASPRRAPRQNEARHLRHPGSRQVIWSAAVLLPLSRRRPHASGTRIELASAKLAASNSNCHPERSEGPAFSSRRGAPCQKNKNRPGEIITGRFFFAQRRLAGPPLSPQAVATAGIVKLESRFSY